MKGLELSAEYCRAVGVPAFQSACPELMERAAFGLAGDGSECLGYDDEISKDHDFGPGFIVWLTDEDYSVYGERALRVYAELPQEFRGFGARNTSAQGGGRVGVMRTSDFYRRFTGCPRGPRTNLQWLAVPEHFLAKAVNGQVFFDPLGEFTSTRNYLLGFYPEEVRYKKLAARAVTLAQSGQYNYPRSIRRGDTGASFFAMREFINGTISMYHLLYRRYTPYYKWSWTSLGELPLKDDVKKLLSYMMFSPLDAGNTQRIERVCDELRRIWLEQGLVQGKSDFFEPLAWELFDRITDESLKNRHITEG